jgi:osmotically-inducible protein OsmY
MKSDSEIERDVRDELAWDPRVGGSDITVAVDNGVVTLGGEVSTLAMKFTVERDAEHVSGVRAVVQHLNVRLPDTHVQSDGDLAQRIADALRWDVEVPDDKVTATVENGWVTLAGTVDRDYQRVSAERAVRYLQGVRGVTNLVALNPSEVSNDVKRRIEAALKRSAETDARHIAVEAAGGAVTLRGTVHSATERREATRAAWAAPGVYSVKDSLSVDI